jgi:hypothetical protein
VEDGAIIVADYSKLCTSNFETDEFQFLELLRCNEYNESDLDKMSHTSDTEQLKIKISAVGPSTKFGRKTRKNMAIPN